jgi:hypothetical protein
MIGETVPFRVGQEMSASQVIQIPPSLLMILCCALVLDQ